MSAVACGGALTLATAMATVAKSSVSSYPSRGWLHDSIIRVCREPLGVCMAYGRPEYLALA